MAKSSLDKNVKILFEKEKYTEVINLLSDQILKKKNSEMLYIWRGNASYKLKDYENALADYDNAIKINKGSEIGYYNKGIALVTQNKYYKAIENCNKVLSINPNSDSALLYRGLINSYLKEYDSAISDYTKSIALKKMNANAYYNRGLAYYKKGVSETSIAEIKKSKEDFKEYQRLTVNEPVDDVSSSYTTDYLKQIDDVLENADILRILYTIDEIKQALLVEDKLVSHYTSLSALQKLVIENSKFRLSEGNFLNDPLEGEALYDYIGINPAGNEKTFSPKPFIGSFVSEVKNDDLNMWRFYGKEKGQEAKGCSITLYMKEFMDKMQDKFSKEIREGRLGTESDLRFYHVVYIDSINKELFCSKNGTTNILKNLMEELRKQVVSIDNKKKIWKYLESILYLFKHDSFKSENELRLVLKGLEFKKKSITMFFRRIHLLSLNQYKT